MKRSLAALLAVSLVACGGDTSSVTQPPPPPLPPITRLVLRDTSALVFAGHAVTGNAFVAHAYDATGAEVADPALRLAAGSGWTVRGDTLIAPTTEGRTTLRISATRPEPTTAEWVHLDGVASDSTVTDSMTVTAGIDLRASRWTVSYVCRFALPREHPSPHDGSVGVDSAGYDHWPVDSVVYPGDTSWVWWYGGLAQVWASGNVTLWAADGVADTTHAMIHLDLAAQGPDTLYWGGYQNAAVVVADSPRVYQEAGGYVSLTLCQEHSASLPDTLRFAETP